jgi:hypothetical protein
LDTSTFGIDVPFGKPNPSRAVGTQCFDPGPKNLLLEALSGLVHHQRLLGEINDYYRPQSRNDEHYD